MRLFIYQFEWGGGARDWVIARNRQAAIDAHRSVTDCSSWEYAEECEVFRLRRDQWKDFTYFEEDPSQTITFEEYMASYTGTDAFFCSTEY